MRRGSSTTLMVGLAGLLAGAGATWAIGIGRMPHPARPTTHGEWVRFPNAAGDSIRAYVAYPERRDKAPGVIVIHEIFGLSDWEPTVADRLAGAGYVAVAPDLLSSRFGATPASPDSGRKLTALLAPEAVTADLDAVYGYLNTLPAVQKDDIATLGFCWGGSRSFRYATANPKLRAAVICYGSAPDSSTFRGIHARLLGVYGEEDARITLTVPELARQLDLAGVRFRYDIYPGTGHGFLRPGRQGSDGPQVEAAWGNILRFLKETL